MPKNKALWTKTFPDQAKKLHPERTKAGGVKARSQSEEVRMEVYRAIRVLFLEAHPYCASVLCGYQGIRSTQVHHRRGRAGLLLFDVRYWTPCCDACHRWIHDHPKEATKLGLIEKR